MRSHIAKLAVVVALCVPVVLDATGPFASRFEEIKQSASRQELYAFLWALPKGGDLHNHFIQTFPAHQWYEAATDPKRNHGNRYFTRLRSLACGADEAPFVMFHMIQRSTTKSCL